MYVGLDGADVGVGQGDGPALAPKHEQRRRGDGLEPDHPVGGEVQLPLLVARLRLPDL